MTAAFQITPAGLKVLRAGIGVFGAGTLCMSMAGLIAAFRDPRLLQTNEVTEVVEGVGLPIELAMIAGLVVPLLTSAVTAVFVFLRRPRDPLAMVFCLMLITLAAYTSRSLTAFSTLFPAIEVLSHAIGIVAFSSFFYFLLVFPAQHFQSRFAAAVWLTSTVFIASRPGFAESLAVRRIGSETSTIDRIYLAGFAALLVAFTVVQIVRYLRATGEARLQMKWVMLPMAAVGLYVTVTIIAPSVFFELSRTWFGVAMVGAIPLALAFPICIARGVLKYRLYDIDLVINRTLVYGALTAILVGVYVALVFAFQGLLEPFTAESDLAVAGSTLAVAGLFRPVRARVQTMIDKGFYRRKFDAQETLAVFGADVRNEVDLYALSARLESVVRETMQPAHVSLWLRAPSGVGR